MLSGTGSDGELLVGRLGVEVGVAVNGEVEREVRADAGVCSHDRHLSRFREDDCWGVCSICRNYLTVVNIINITN